MHHLRKTRKQYQKHNHSDTPGVCPFPSCIETKSQKPVFENETMYVIANRVPYDTFEALVVEDHLMVIPKRHVEQLTDFTDKEKLDAMNIMAEYDQRGYSAYARSVTNIHRSVQHQHTHLIKLKRKRLRFLLFVRRPYLVARG